MLTLSSIKSYIFDIIFPIYCLGCGREGEWICLKCFNTIPQDIHNSLHESKIKSPLDGLLVATTYHQPIIQSAIQILKYQGVTEIVKSLSTLLLNRLMRFDRTNGCSILGNRSNLILVPVPLHRKRRLNRGFNQSLLLARDLSSMTRLPVINDALTRTRHTTAQATLSRKERLTNLRGAFAATMPFKLSGKNVILIDDVATTLSTLTECASALKKAGCKQVWGLVIARGS